MWVESNGVSLENLSREWSFASNELAIWLSRNHPTYWLAFGLLFAKRDMSSKVPQSDGSSKFQLHPHWHTGVRPKKVTALRPQFLRFVKKMGENLCESGFPRVQNESKITITKSWRTGIWKNKVMRRRSTQHRTKLSFQEFSPINFKRMISQSDLCH